jgi:hypothetical protein
MGRRQRGNAASALKTSKEAVSSSVPSAASSFYMNSAFWDGCEGAMCVHSAVLISMIDLLFLPRHFIIE